MEKKTLLQVTRYEIEQERLIGHERDSYKR